jgi:hypothetical protein
MNRRERRDMQKKLGLTKFYKNQTPEQRNKRLNDNQENGQRMMTDMAERVRVAQNMSAEDKESLAISNIAQRIAQQKEIPMVDAMAEARMEYNSKK